MCEFHFHFILIAFHLNLVLWGVLTTPIIENLDFARIPFKFFKQIQVLAYGAENLPIFQFLHGVEIRSKKHTQKIEVRTCIVQIKQTIRIFRQNYRRTDERTGERTIC